MIRNSFLLLIIFLFPLICCYGQGNKDSILSSKSDTIIKEVRIFASRKNIFSRLLSNFLVKEKKATPTIEKQPSNTTFEEHEGKYIRNIDIYVLEVFGSSINNLAKKERGKLEQLGNDVHRTTREWVIKHRLLFNKGEALEPLKISESERLLRQYRNTYDARIFVTKTPNSGDSVDVFVLTQDVWAVTAAGGLSPAIPAGNLSLRNVNFLGFGNELAGQVRYNRRDSVNWHYGLEYTNNNIAKTLFVGNVYYKDLSIERNYGIGINRDFISPTIKFAGGLSLNWFDDKRFIYGLDSIVESYGSSNNQQEIWLGYSTDLNKSKNENRYYAAARILRTNYTKFPAKDSFLLAYQQNTLYIASIGYSYRRFIKDNFIFGLGRTEDIPVGTSFSITAGYSNGKIADRPYIGLRASSSTYMKRIGYVFGSIEFGGYRFYDNWQDQVVTAEILYYSKLIPLGDWRWRSFLWNRLTHGYNTAPGRILNINRREGLRGFSGGYVYGNKKYVINYESVFYTPFTFLGFRTAFVLFGDFAFIGRNTDPLFQGKFYQAYGIGFRFRNEHLIFRTIQVTLAYYPNVSNINEQAIKLFEESNAFYQFPNFQFLKPRPVEF